MIDIVNNILSLEKRTKCVEDLQPLLTNIPYFPGRQTHSTLHLHPDFNELKEIITQKVITSVGEDLVLIRMWAKWISGKREHMNWHNHLPYDYSVVYYLKVPLFMKNGTLFEKRGLFRSEENSLIIFPSKLNHSSPSYFWKGDRYVISADFMSQSKADFITNK